MVDLHHIISRISTNLELYHRLSYLQLSSFLEATIRLLPAITLKKPRLTIDLPALPDHVINVLSVQVRLSTAGIRSLWGALGRVILQTERAELVVDGAVDRVLAEVGPVHALGRQ